MADLLQPIIRPLVQAVVLAANSKESPAQLSGGSGGGGVPANALTLNGQVLTLNGQTLTLGA